MNALKEVSHKATEVHVLEPGVRYEKHIDSLDALRGVAILLVVLGHYVPGRLIDGVFAEFIRPCAVGGVILFFLLSGCLIEKNLKRNGKPAAYALRRGARIFPAYLFSILVLLILGAVQGSAYYSGREILFNAALLQDVFAVPLINAAFWTLLIEIKFYVMAPAITGIGDKAIRIAPYLAIALNAMIAMRRGEASNLLTYLAVCFVGMNFGLWHRGGLPNIALLVVAACTALSIGVFSPYMKIGLAIFVLINAGLLTLALRGGAYFPRLPAFAFIGAISYSWYLYHSGLGYPLMASLEAPMIGLSPWISVPVAALITLGAAWLSYLAIERPGISLGRRIEKAWIGSSKA